MSTSKADYAALLPVVQEIALQLTKLTAREWTVRKNEEPEPYFHLLSGDSELLISTEYSKPERLVVNGITPRGKDRQYVRVYENVDTGHGTRWEEAKFASITVATGRGAEAIAKEINRRFLPDYVHVVSLTLEKIQKDEDFEQKRLANLQACAATLNEVITAPYGHNTRIEDRTEFSHYFGANCSGIRVEVKASATDVDVDLDNLTIAQAQQVLALVKTFAKANKATA